MRFLAQSVNTSSTEIESVSTCGQLGHGQAYMDSTDGYWLVADGSSHEG